MTCVNTIIILVIVLLLLTMTKAEMFSFVNTDGLDNPLVVFQKPIYPTEVPIPMSSYFPSEKLSYIGSEEPSCNNGYGYYNYDPSKRGKNAKVMFNNQEYDAECSPYALKPELMVCSLKDKNNRLEFYGFMPKKC